VLAAVQVETLAALVTTGYGRLLLLKLAAVAALLGLAAWNKRRLTPHLAAGDEAAARRLRRSIGAEMAVAAAVLALTAALGQTVPPRALDAGHDHGAPAGYTVVASADDLTATVAVAPARIGRNGADIFLQRPDGAPLRALALEIELALPAAGVEPLVRTARAVEPGHYRLGALDIPLAGRWTLTLGVLISDFDKRHIAVVLPIR
jgi:copper transport protein